MKKTVFVLLSLIFLLTGCDYAGEDDNSAGVSAIENGTDGTYTGTDDENVPTKKVRFIDLPSETFENMGVDEVYLQEVGFTEAESLEIIRSGFSNIRSITEGKDEATKAKIKNFTIDVPIMSDNSRAVAPKWKVCTVNGKPNQKFHPDVDTARIDEYVMKARSIAFDLFTETDFINHIHIRYAYYMWGEYDPAIGVHEGIDMNVNQLEGDGTFRTVVSGIVNEVQHDGSGMGKLALYVSRENSTYFFLHAKRYEGYITKGKSISGRYYAGLQGGTGNGKQIYPPHVHIGTEKGSTTFCASGTDLDLRSQIPYDKFYKYVDPKYKF